MDFDSIAPGTEPSDSLARRVSTLDHARARPPLPQNPAEVLARLLDFSGSVALAKLLRERPRPANGPAADDAAERAAKLRIKARTRLDKLLPRALERITRERAASGVDSAGLFALLERLSGKRGHAPQGPAADRLVRELGGPIRNALLASLQRAHADLGMLRIEIAYDLQALGPRAAWLERIDADLQRSIEAKLLELMERVAQAADQTFERSCLRACAALPGEFDEAALASWLGKDGWIERHRELCARMTHAFCGHLQANLEGLVLAAMQAEAAA